MATTTCHWHSDRETGLHCSNCGKPMCVECMRQHPVGVRCKECSRQNVLPTYQISTSYYARGIAAALGLGLAGAIGLSVLLALFPTVGFFFFILMGGLGYVIGEGLGRAVNYRRGRPYQYMALAGVLLATVPVFFESIFVARSASIVVLFGIGIAVWIAWNRRA
jgi:hypothetical protein